MAVTYDYYRIFYYVGKYHSFTRAAKILGNSQPNITRSMNNLEAELGCRLFLRSPRGIMLTPEGEKLYAHIQVAYEHIRAGEAEIADEKDLRSGYLSIGASEIALHSLLLPVLRRFRGAYPGVHIQITNHSTPQAVSAVKSGMVELAVVTTPTGVERPLQEMKLLPFQDILITGSDFIGYIDKPIKLSELLNYPLISLGRDTKSFEFYDNLFSKKGLTLEPDIEAATTDQVIPMVKNGLGFGFVPKNLACDSIARKEIYEVPMMEDIPLRYICLVQDRSRPLSTAAKRLIRMLSEFSYTDIEACRAEDGIL